MTEPIEIGWQVVDADGNVVASGPIVIAELTTEIQEKIEQE